MWLPLRQGWGPACSPALDVHGGAMGATLFFDHCGSVRDRDVPTGFKARGREGRCPGRARARIAAGTGDAPAFASDMIRVSGSICVNSRILVGCNMVYSRPNITVTT